jgi:outer membrane protease
VFIALLAGSAVCLQASAEPARTVTGRRGDVTLSGGIGLATLQGDEYVFNSDGTIGSHLVWKTRRIPVGHLEAEWQVDPHWALLGSLSVNLTHGHSYMQDYDWFIPGRDWTDLSSHPDTSLDHYAALDAGVRYELLRRNAWSLGLLGGFHYTDVKWTAYGGSYIYSSSGGFRDLIGDFPEGERGITFRQMLPAVYLGPAASLRLDRLTLTASVVGGLSFDARDIDDHWLRDLRFRDDLDPAPYLGIKARETYRVGPAVALFLGLDYQEYFRMKGSTTTTDTTTGAVSYEGGDAAGGSFRAFSVNAGLSARF